MSLEELKYFFSYTRSDSEFVLKLAKELRAVGVNLWLDQLDILGGQHWDRTVEKALKSCKGMIAVLSPEAAASDNVMDEVSYALNKGKLVVPVLVRSCEIPLRLERLHYVDFTTDYDTGFTQLLRALHIEQPVQPRKSDTVQEPSLPKQSEPAPDAVDYPKPTDLETEKAGRKTRVAKVITAICIAAFLAIVSTVCFLIYFKTYSLTVTAVDGLVATDPNQANYKRGENVTLTAVPDPNYRFNVWSGALSDSNNPATLVMDGDKSVTANFVKTYGLSVTAIGGSVTKDPNQPRYDDGESVTLLAVSKEWYSFTNWSGDLSGSTNPATLVMDTDKSVTAGFTLITHNLTVTAVNGSVTKSPNLASYNHDETVTLKAVPNTGYRFTNWSGNLSGSTNPATLVMYTDMSVTASFTLITHNLTATAVDGSVTKSPDLTSYNQGETVTLKAVPNDGYSFTNWSGDLSGSTNPATLVMDTDKSVTANFALKAVAPPPSSHDDCEKAMVIGDVKDLSFDTTNATFDGSGLCMGSPNLWYCYTATCTGNVTVSLAGSSFDTMLAVYDGCECYPKLDDLIECNDDAGAGRQSAVTFAAIAGKKYLIEVGGYGAEKGEGLISISCGRATPPLSSQDDCEKATEIGDVKDLSFDTTNATFDGSGLCITSPNIWYCYTALCTGDVTVSLAGSSFDTKLAVYRGYACFPKVHDIIDCNDDADGSHQSKVTFAAIAGNKYLIEIGGYTSETTGLGILNISYEGELIRPLCEDVNVDGVIDMKDLTTLTELWLENCPDKVAEPNCLCRDVDGDGVIDLKDLSTLTELWLEDCD